MPKEKCFRYFCGGQKCVLKCLPMWQSIIFFSSFHIFNNATSSLRKLFHFIFFYRVSSLIIFHQLLFSICLKWHICYSQAPSILFENDKQRFICVCIGLLFIGGLHQSDWNGVWSRFHMKILIEIIYRFILFLKSHSLQ